MEVGTCTSLSEQTFGDLNYLWSIIRYCYFQFFPKVAFAEYDPGMNKSEKKLWMLQKLALEGWTPLPFDEGCTEDIYQEPDLQDMLSILEDEADPACKFSTIFAMLPFTEFPEGQPRYSLPTKNNVPAVVRYICIDFEEASNMDIQEFSQLLKDATCDGWKIYKDNLATVCDEYDRAKYHCWEAESSGSVNSKKRSSSPVPANAVVSRRSRSARTNPLDPSIE